MALSKKYGLSSPGGSNSVPNGKFVLPKDMKRYKQTVPDRNIIYGGNLSGPPTSTNRTGNPQLMN